MSSIQRLRTVADEKGKKKIESVVKHKPTNNYVWRPKQEESTGNYHIISDTAHKKVVLKVIHVVEQMTAKVEYKVAVRADNRSLAIMQ